jgi:hypothetical protein
VVKIGSTLYGHCIDTYGALVTAEPEETVTRTLRVDPELWTAVKMIARRRGENVSVVIRRALIAYVEADHARAQNIPHAS